MLKEALDLGKRIFAVTRDVQENKDDIKKLSGDVKELRQEVLALALAVDRLNNTILRDRESAEQERKIQRLEIENRFMKYEIRLLSPGSKDESTA